MTDGITHNEIDDGFFFSAVVQGREITVQLPPQVQTALRGLPAPSPSFVGRKDDLQLILDLVRPGSAARLCAVAGLGGVGKTELALQAAHMAIVQDWFPGGVLFVDLFGYDSQRRVEPATALDGLLRALGIPGEHIPTEIQDRSRLFSSVLAAYAERRREIIVVVDNALSAAQARPLLPRSGAAIVTSRHSLADLDARLLELEVLVPEASVELLAKRLRVTRGADDTRVVAAPRDALEVARLCTGLPLALHIVASLLTISPHRSLASMVADLRDARTRLDELSYGQGDDERAVRAVFDLSYAQLSSVQARTFRLLTLNPGPEVSSEAAAVLKGGNRRACRKCLEELARAHLIEQGTADDRWRMHDLLRIYASEKREASATADRTGRAFTALLEHYESVARAAIRHLDPTDGTPSTGRFSNREQALAWLDTEYLNLIAAVTSAADVNLRTARDLPHTLWNFLALRRYFADWVLLSGYSLRAARSLGDRSAEARALNHLGMALNGEQKFNEAIRRYQEAARIFREIGNLDGQGMVLNNLGGTLAAIGRLDEAAAACRKSASIYSDHGHQHGKARALATLTDILRRSGHYELAIEASQEAHQIFRETGDLNGQAITLDGLGLALLSVGRFGDARAACEEAVSIYRDLGDQHSLATSLRTLGLALSALGRHEESIDALREAVALFRNTDAPYDAGAAMGDIGLALTSDGRYGEAVAAYEEAASIFHEHGHHSEAESAREKLAEIRKQRSRPRRLFRLWTFGRQRK
jgi:tetratricopeptide (TPR) repeat protein